MDGPRDLFDEGRASSTVKVRNSGAWHLKSTAAKLGNQFGAVAASGGAV